MKTTLFKILAFAFFLISPIVFSQQIAYDKLFFLNQDEFDVIIVKIDKNEIQYKFPNETFLNIIEKEEIEKIIFKSGRIQHFNQIKQAAKKTYYPIEKNTIAILPIPFIKVDDGSVDGKQKAKLAQAKVFNFLTERLGHIYPKKLQSTRQTNTRLKQAGVSIENIDEYSIEEIQKHLGVDYVITGHINYIVKVEKRSSSSSDVEIKEKRDKVILDGDSSNSKSEILKYDYTVYLDIYNEGDLIYSKNRAPLLFNARDAWTAPFEYLLKRTPIYNKKR